MVRLKVMIDIFFFAARYDEFSFFFFVIIFSDHVILYVLNLDFMTQ